MDGLLNPHCREGPVGQVSYTDVVTATTETLCSFVAFFLVDFAKEFDNKQSNLTLTFYCQLPSFIYTKYCTQIIYIIYHLP